MGYFSEKALDIEYEVEEREIIDFTRKHINPISSYDIPDEMGDKVKWLKERRNFIEKMRLK